MLPLCWQEAMDYFWMPEWLGKEGPQDATGVFQQELQGFSNGMIAYNSMWLLMSLECKDMYLSEIQLIYKTMF